MNPEQQDFAQLRRLMALKRHEQPPPGYFSDFSRQVIHRIREGEQAEDRFEASWIERFWGLVESRPLWAGGFGLAACGVIVVGLALSDAPSGVSAISDPSVPTVSSFAKLPERPASDQPVLVGVTSTNGALMPAGPQSSLFSDLATPRAQPASFQIPGRN